MSMRIPLFIALLAGLAGNASAQSAEQVPMLDWLTPSWHGITTSVEGVDIEQDLTRIAVMKWSTEAAGLELSDVTLERSGNAVLVSAAEGVLSGVAQETPGVRIAGLSARLEAPIGQDGVCGTLAAVSRLSLSRMSWQERDREDPRVARLAGVNFEASETEACHLSGILSVSWALLDRADGSGAQAEDATIDLDIPVSRAAIVPGSLATISAKARLATLKVEGGAPAISLSGASVEAAFDEASLVAATFAVPRANPFLKGWNRLSSRMDLWNMTTFLEGHVSMDFGSVQMISSAVIPTEMTANFRRVGLSIMTAMPRGRFTFSPGMIGFDVKSEIVGAGHVETSGMWSAAPYSRADLDRADRRDPDFSPRSRLALVGIEGIWRDEGFGKLFSDLFGLRPAPFLERMAGADRNEAGTIPMAEFFAKAEPEVAVPFSYRPDAPVPLEDIGARVADIPSLIFPEK